MTKAKETKILVRKKQRDNKKEKRYLTHKYETNVLARDERNSSSFACEQEAAFSRVVVAHVVVQKKTTTAKWKIWRKEGGGGSATLARFRKRENDDFEEHEWGETVSVPGGLRRDGPTGKTSATKSERRWRGFRRNPVPSGRT